MKETTPLEGESHQRYPDFNSRRSLGRSVLLTLCLGHSVTYFATLQLTFAVKPQTVLPTLS